MDNLLPRLAAALVLCALGTGTAGAHGGLPLTNQVLWRGDDLLVPTLRWGVFVGASAGAGPWHWICDESINANLLRNVYLGGDGTLYATDSPGLTVSRDGGCTWEEAPGEVASFDYLFVATDPVAPASIWFAADSQPTQAEVWRSDDAARTWKRYYALPGWGSAGLALLPDGKTVHLLAVALGKDPQPSVYTSSDDGTSFQKHPVGTLPSDVSPLQLYLIGADPRDAGVVYLRSSAGTTDQVLLRADLNKGTVTEVVRTIHVINDVAVDIARDRLLVATGEGIFTADGPAAARHSTALSYSQCVTVHGDKTYACASDYAPDRAAVAVSADGAQSFQKVFQFEDTQGILDCPAGTSVAKICPTIWRIYGPLLLNPPPIYTGQDMGTASSVDQGGADGPSQPAMGGCGCRAAGRDAGWTGVLLLVCLLLLPRARRR